MFNQLACFRPLVAVAATVVARQGLSTATASSAPTSRVANDPPNQPTAPPTKHADVGVGRVRNPITTKHSEYIQGIKIYDIGIKEDPVPGEKRGKGIQHLTSSYWIYDMSVFIQRNFRAMQTMMRYAHERSNNHEGYDFRYFINVSNALFLKAEAEGLRTASGRDYFLMACWLAMAAAEVDGFPYGKYTTEERASHRKSFYKKYLSPDVVWVENEADDIDIERTLGKYAIESCRIDLLPTVALERLGLHNELCALKWNDPNKWMQEGFVVRTRFDSMKRHYESVHAKDRSEDHLAHLIWGFMALTHVIAVFPQLNDLTDFETIRRKNVVALSDSHVAELVGDGGFRSGVPGKTRQSGRHPAALGGGNKLIPATANSFFRLDT